ncbi:MAG: hypothetical protein C4293_14250 [Nitrospiraceae bacterium]
MTIPITLIGLTVLVSGCQTAKPLEKTGLIDNTAFMGLWKTYRHCKAGVDPEVMRADAQHLTQVAHQPTPKTGEIPLPKVIQQMVAEPIPRLAVDPKAMAAACSLYTGRVALEIGRLDVADEMFRLVLKYPETSYPYYVAQARAGLDLMTIGIQASPPPQISYLSWRSLHCGENQLA